MKILIKTKETGSDAVATAAGMKASCTMGGEHAAKRLAQKLSGGAGAVVLKLHAHVSYWEKIFCAEWADHPETIEMWTRYEGFGYIVKSARTAGGELPVNQKLQRHTGSGRAAAENFAKSRFQGRAFVVLPGDTSRNFKAFPAAAAA